MGSAPKVANGDILFFQKLQQLQLILKHFPSKYQKKKYTLQSHIFMGNPNLQKRNLKIDLWPHGKFKNIDQSTFPQRGPRSTDNFHPESPKMRIFWEGPSRDTHQKQFRHIARHSIRDRDSLETLENTHWMRDISGSSHEWAERASERSRASDKRCGTNERCGASGTFSTVPFFTDRSIPLRFRARDARSDPSCRGYPCTERRWWEWWPWIRHLRTPPTLEVDSWWRWTRSSPWRSKPRLGERLSRFFFLRGCWMKYAGLAVPHIAKVASIGPSRQGNVWEPILRTSAFLFFQNSYGKGFIFERSFRLLRRWLRKYLS